MKTDSETVWESPLTVGDVIKRMLPSGSSLRAARAPWSACPEWAADVFAVAAAIVHASSCYAEPGIALSQTDKEREQKLDRARLHAETGQKWSTSVSVPPLVETHWSVLHDQCFNSPISDQSRFSKKWKSSALALVAISDEAMAGAGYFPSGSDGIANFVWDELIRSDRKYSLGLPHSLCLLVPNEIACVLPKSLTPNVGCTLRSLTHNVAFLPGRGVVKPEWLINPSDELSSRIRGSRSKKGKVVDEVPDGVFNILIVPFPYVIHATDFIASRKAKGDGDGYFTLSQGWLKDGARRISPTAMAKFIGDLISTARSDVGPIHAVVLPEVALDEAIGDGTAKLLAKRFPELELFVTGQAIGLPPSQRNVAAQYRLLDGTVVSTVKQSKHHRWRLEGNQIRQYQLGGTLDPNHNWWEHIDVHDRHIGFSINRHGAIVSALVCEDLARQEPVLPTVVAVGPTLVIALLLDGPQLPNRWPGRYATVLAEDPGSSVLTVSNLGMIDRSVMPGADNRRVVGLWKDNHAAAKELTLPAGHHGLVLSLNCCNRKQVSLDHRTASRRIVEYRLGATRAVRLDGAPKWLERRTTDV
ncbi:hypothetical protein CDS [Bradyrhizobium sp.]|uniref:hypothetical protein n=1 Tax=Bradyrhizobium sp. TaxID=376 RepID=UPI0007C1F305|nr:hypothetical protein [Bradyrhizobium sp.]CUU14672.1 hypothetical protein CDS [Bradyrhizobium sp.]